MEDKLVNLLILGESADLTYIQISVSTQLYISRCFRIECVTKGLNHLRLAGESSEFLMCLGIRGSPGLVLFTSNVGLLTLQV